jgi:hypothetical protein
MKLPYTTPTAYLSGFTALNIPDPNRRNGDWHFTSAFMDPQAKIFVAGNLPGAFVNTNGILHDEGIVERGDVLRAYGLTLESGEKVYAADYIRAVTDLLIACADAGENSDFVIAADLFDTHEDWQNILRRVNAVAELPASVRIRPHLKRWIEQQHYDHA